MKTRPPGPFPSPTTRHPSPRRGAVLPGRPCPGPADSPAGSGRRLGTADRRAGRGRADGRAAVVGLGVEADPRPEGDSHRLREEEGAAVEDRRMDPAAGRGGLPVRPRAIDPIILPIPPRGRVPPGCRPIAATGPAGSSSPGGGSSWRKSSANSVQVTSDSCHARPDRRPRRAISRIARSDDPCGPAPDRRPRLCRSGANRVRCGSPASPSTRR